MDVNSLMGNFMGMPGMNMNMNPFMQFLNQSGINPSWMAGLASMGMSMTIYHLSCKTVKNQLAVQKN